MAETPLLRRAKLITNWFDQELADIVGMKRATVQAVISGRTPEYLDTRQKTILIAAVRDFVREANDGLEEMELFA